MSEYPVDHDGPMTQSDIMDMIKRHEAEPPNGETEIHFQTPHTSEGLGAAYNINTGVLTLTCGGCDTIVASFLIASKKPMH